MASITKIKKKKGVAYRVTWRVGAGKDRRQEYETFEKWDDANKYKTKMEKEVEQRRVGSAKRISVFEYLDEWIKAKGADKKNPISAKTVEGYERNIGIAKRGLKKDRPLSQLDKPHLDKAYDELLESGKLLIDGETGPLARRTVLHVHRVLHKAFADAVDNNLITENPASRAEAPRAQSKKYKTNVRPFTKTEQELLFKLARDEGVGAETFVIAMTFTVTGMRLGELTGLAEDAVDWEPNEDGKHMLRVLRTVDELKNKDWSEGSDQTRTIAVMKEKAKTESGAREIEIPPALVELLRQQRTRVREAALAYGRGYQRKPMFLFPATDGGPQMPKLITRRMERLIARAKIVPGKGKKISPCHSWRHTHGTMLWGATKDIKLVQERSGHATAAITMELYVHNTPDADSVAASVMGNLMKELSGGRKKP